MTPQGLEFTLFPKLPTELRFKVWAMAFLSRVSRVVEIRIREQTDSNSDSESPASPYLWSPSPPPALANSCREARQMVTELARKTGQLLFNRIFFDPAIDILYGPKK